MINKNHGGAGVLSTSELATTLRDQSRLLSYNANQAEGDAKWLMREAAHRLDKMDTRVLYKKGPLRVVNGLGQRRVMTYKEGILWALFKIIPREV